jgi:hypothetical protein
VARLKAEKHGPKKTLVATKDVIEFIAALDARGKTIGDNA